MYDRKLHQQVIRTLQEKNIDLAGSDNLFYTRFIAGATSLSALYHELYAAHPQSEACFRNLLQTILAAHISRPPAMRHRDEEKEEGGHWFLSNEITGMSLYVDRFCGTLNQLEDKLPYLQELGVNLLHLMPLFESPPGESDGGYAVSDFRNVDSRFGTLDDLKEVQQRLREKGMYLMLDIVLNHTSHHHEWAQKAKSGDAAYQDFFYMYPNRNMPDLFETAMPDVFPESAPGSFTWVAECNNWVMTVFHNYQWDLNFSNPAVFIAMLDTIFFYANLGVDILRIDAPAFIWKRLGTSCQNLPEAHTLLRLIRQCVQIAAPGMALLGEAIVAPAAIMKYFGTGLYTAKECDVAYNATHMALQWDALATGDTGVMLAAQHELLQKPYGTSWITYTRCHDDIGLGYEDYMIQQAGYDPYLHRLFLKDYYSGSYPGTPATGALFSINPKTGDARISGSLASLCGLEKAVREGNEADMEQAIRRILLMQAHSLFIGGIPMLFYGDEAGYTNDYSYRSDAGKSYDNRWMHRPLIDWKKNKRKDMEDTIEQKIFSATQRLIGFRKRLPAVADHKNSTWMATGSRHIAGFVRARDEQRLFCLFNFSPHRIRTDSSMFENHGPRPATLFDHWAQKSYTIGNDPETMWLDGYSFLLLEPATEPPIVESIGMGI